MESRLRQWKAGYGDGKTEQNLVRSCGRTEPPLPTTPYLGGNTRDERAKVGFVAQLLRLAAEPVEAPPQRTLIRPAHGGRDILEPHALGEADSDLSGAEVIKTTLAVAVPQRCRGGR